jgi:hypothetical protein
MDLRWDRCAFDYGRQASREYDREEGHSHCINRDRGLCYFSCPPHAERIAGVSTYSSLSGFSAHGRVSIAWPCPEEVILDIGAGVASNYPDCMNDIFWTGSNTIVH